MKPKRIQRKRTKGWRMPPNTIYVGRPTKFGNPFIVGTYYNSYKRKVITPEIAVELFRHLVTASEALRLEFWGGPMEIFRDDILEDIHELKGKDLACWCRLDQPCHADVLLEIANNEKSG